MRENLLLCPVDALRPAYEVAAQHFVEDFALARWLPRYADFKAYLTDWAEMLERAATSGSGIVVMPP